MTESGKVYAFGRGNSGKLGDDDTSVHDEGIPKLINPDYFNNGENNEKIIHISSGPAHSLVIADRMPQAAYDRSGIWNGLCFWFWVIWKIRRW